MAETASCADKPDMAPTLRVNAYDPILTVPIKTRPVRKAETKADRKRRKENEADRILTLLRRVMEEIACRYDLDSVQPRVMYSLK